MLHLCPMGTLDQYEQEQRSLIKLQANEKPDYSLVRAALISFLILPFATIEFIFIPILGHFLVGIGAFLSIWYLTVKRSWKLVFTVIAALLASSICMVTLSSAFERESNLALWLFLGFGTIVCFVFDGVMAGALWLHFNYSEYLKRPTVV